MPRVTGYMADELTSEYITQGGTVRAIDELRPGSYVVSIVDVEGYNPINKLLDIEEGESEIDLGWFAGKALPHSMWGVHNDYEEA